MLRNSLQRTNWKNISYVLRNLNSRNINPRRNIYQKLPSCQSRRRNNKPNLRKSRSTRHYINFNVVKRFDFGDLQCYTININ